MRHEMIGLSLTRTARDAVLLCKEQAHRERGVADRWRRETLMRIWQL
jgi:hypothetical protein